MAAHAPDAASSSATKAYAERLESERSHFDQVVNVHALPRIFHYWSVKYIAPKFERFGFQQPERFFQQAVAKACRSHDGRTVRVVSVGAGNCDSEARIARRLVEEDGVSNFEIECLDISEPMLVRALGHAEKADVASHIRPLVGDFNQWHPEHAYDVVIAKQSLHHVMELESLFAAIRDCLEDDGRFVTSDMIGRNGHQRWPEALEAMQPFWDELPARYHFNHSSGRQEDEFINRDYSSAGFEGIRAQDILPLLADTFEFELFIPYGNIVFPFVDRGFGHNFDSQDPRDRDFIDRLHAADEAGLLAGELTPTAMVASLSKERVETQLLDPRLTPQACIRVP